MINVKIEKKKKEEDTKFSLRDILGRPGIYKEHGMVGYYVVANYGYILCVGGQKDLEVIEPDNCDDIKCLEDVSDNVTVDMIVTVEEE